MRFLAIDQVRGAAIFAMILAHFGPGLWSRIGLQGAPLDIITLIGRFATPTFIAIFGMTIAFAYIPKAQANPWAIQKKLLLRSRTVFFASALVSTPALINTLNSHIFWGDSITLNLILDAYGVLTFYVIAILFTSMIIPYIARSPYYFPMALGSALIYLGTFLGFDYWGSGHQTGTELLRLYLVSGKYAFLTNYGIVLLIVSFGVLIRAMMLEGKNVNKILFLSGFCIILFGLSNGRIVGWRHISDLHSKYDAPPQVWYILTIFGVMTIALFIFNKFKIPFVSFLMEHIGRNPLSIYVAHAFVLPITAMLRKISPNTPDFLNISLPLLAFFIFTAVILMRSSRNHLV